MGVEKCAGEKAKANAGGKGEESGAGFDGDEVAELEHRHENGGEQDVEHPPAADELDGVPCASEVLTPHPTTARADQQETGELGEREDNRAEEYGQTDEDLAADKQVHAALENTAGVVVS